MISDAFAERFKTVLKESKMTQQNFADALNVPKSTVLSWLYSGRMPEIPRLVEIADFFGCTTDYLLGRSDVRTFTAPQEIPGGVGVDVIAPPSNPVSIDIDLKSIDMDADTLQSVIQAAIEKAIKKTGKA